MKISAKKINKAIQCIKNRVAYNIKEKRTVFVNKLIYWGNDLMLNGFTPSSRFKVEDYGITWKVLQPVNYVELLENLKENKDDK